MAAKVDKEFGKCTSLAHLMCSLGWWNTFPDCGSERAKGLQSWSMGHLPTNILVYQT